MKHFTLSLPMVLVGLVLIFGINFIFVVNESEQVIVTEFGKPKDRPIVKPGIYVKIPVLQELHYLDKRYLEWDGDPNQVPTKDKKFIFVDSYARWQIKDPLQFFKRFRDERAAISRLDDILDGETRNAVADNNLTEIIRTSNRVPAKSEEFHDETDEVLSQIYVGREKIQKRILKIANERTSDLGIEILDFKIKRINYVEEVRRKVYERMISERNRIAEKFRSEGMGESSRINGEMEKELKRITSEAFKTSQEIKGKADAQAAAIYANAYNKSDKSRELYSFVKSMETFEKTFDKETTMVLSTKSDLYRFLNSNK